MQRQVREPGECQRGAAEGLKYISSVHGVVLHFLVGVICQAGIQRRMRFMATAHGVCLLLLSNATVFHELLRYAILSS